jgi:hypothetical protein
VFYQTFETPLSARQERVAVPPEQRLEKVLEEPHRSKRASNLFEQHKAPARAKHSRATW